MDIVISIAAKISEYLVEPVTRPAGYLIFYNRNVSTLNSQVEELGHVRSRVQHTVEAARWNGELIHDDVHSWLTKVNEINGQVEIFQNEVKGNKGCLGGWCPNPISRYSLSRKAKKTTEAINELKAKGSFPSVSYSPPPPGFVYKATEGFADFESRKLIMEDIMAALKDDNIHSIGICGLGGVGKTTTVKEVGSRAKAEKLCDAITMAVVSQTPDVKKIQGAIADMLGLELKGESPSGRADRLRARLMDGTRVLVILDDVWERLNLEAVGIPFGGDRKGCRLMITSRNEEVCKSMKTCKNFRIGVLSEPEAWKLFKEMAGNSIESDNDLNPIAQEVVKECGGLPIAIVTVGRALENEAKQTWKDALRQLKMPRPENIPEMLKEVYGQLELSYNSLKTQDAKSCLLFCCMFPEDANIPVERLVVYGMVLGWFEGIEALVEARNRVHSLVRKLKHCSLLLDGEDEEEDCVRMHDVVRDVIRHIATTEGRGNQYAILPLMSGSEINGLRDRLDCPKLELLLMGNEEDDLLKVRDIHLFEGMIELRVLLMCRVTLIPSSGLSFLKKLRSLDLWECELENISAIAELQTLMTLNLNDSSIDELPQEIGKLTRLRLLDLTSCNLKIVSPGVISSLFQLEELYLLGSGLQWVVEGESRGKNELNLSELVPLSNLIALDTHLPSAKFPNGINILFEKLERFGIHIGIDEDRWRHTKRLQNKLILKLDTRIPVDSGIHVLLKKTETLRLQLKGAKSILNYLTRENPVQLKSLKLDSCEGLEYLIDTVDLVQHSIYLILESLNLRSMLNLKMICHGQFPSGSFEKLRHIEVDYCDVLENLFSQSIARGLVRLEVLKIRRCKMIEEIVATERGEHAEAINKIRFPKLRELTLEELPSIIGLCKSINEIELPQLSTLDLKDLPKLRSFCANSLTLEYNHGTATQHLFNEEVMSLCELRSVIVWRCNNLLNVFSSNLVQSLQNLEKLVVENCDSLELVFDFAGINIEEGHATSALTCLKNLTLVCLPKLTHLWKKAPPQIQGFQSLLSVEVGDCRSLKNIFTPSIAKLLVKLEELRVSDCAITEIVGKDEEDGEENEEVTKVILFPQLNSLRLENLPDLMSFGPEPYTFKWPTLKDLSLNNANMKVFVPAFLSAQKQRTINVKSNEKQQIIYPSLEVLQLGGEKDDVEWILDCQLPDESLCKLREIHLLRCNQLLVFPSNLLPRLPKLEELTIKHCNSLVEVFQVEGLHVKERDMVLLPKLKELRLKFLPKLKHIWKREPRGFLFFQNLSVLHVWKCNSLRNLFTPSTAKITEQLQELEINYCKTMTEIVAEDEGEGDEKAIDKIEFPQLRGLYLCGLPNFVSFFPKVSNSTSNILKTENSKAIDVGSGEILPHVNLHTHIHHLFNEKVAFPSLEELSLDGMNKLNEIWCEMDHKGIRGFQNLKSLRVMNCGSLRHVFYPSMAKGLLHLEQLEIEDCKMMEEIVVKGENEKEDGMDTVKIPRLESLTLDGLPNLTSFCQGLYAFDLPSLEDVIINCPKMKTFSFGSLSTPMLQIVRENYEGQSWWMDDLNNTVQQLFKRKVEVEDGDDDDDDDEEDYDDHDDDDDDDDEEDYDDHDDDEEDFN